jgi:hypothetical protein
MRRQSSATNAGAGSAGDAGEDEAAGGIDNLRRAGRRPSLPRPLNHPRPFAAMGQKPAFQYEPGERFGEGLTTSRPWNVAALQGVERLNGRVAMLGFLAAVVGEGLTGQGIIGQLALLLRWLLG